MATIGLNNLHVAKMTSEGVYETPIRLAGAISVKMSVAVSEATLHADDRAKEIIKEFKNGSMSLNGDDITNENMALLLGQTLQPDGTLFAGADDVAPYFAVGFSARKPNGQYRFLWFLKCKFKVNSDEFNTKGDSISFSTPTIEGEFVALDSGIWKADYTGTLDSDVGKIWFNSVKLPA